MSMWPFRVDVPGIIPGEVHYVPDTEGTFPKNLQREPPGFGGAFAHDLGTAASIRSNSSVVIGRPFMASSSSTASILSTLEF